MEALIHLVRYITVLEPSPGSTSSKAYRAAGVPGVAGGAPVAGAPRQAAAVERVPVQSKQVRCGGAWGRSVEKCGGSRREWGKLPAWSMCWHSKRNLQGGGKKAWL